MTSVRAECPIHRAASSAMSGSALPKAQSQSRNQPTIQIAPRPKNKPLKNLSKFACQAQKSSIPHRINHIDLAEQFPQLTTLKSAAEKAGRPAWDYLYNPFILTTLTLKPFR